MTSTDKIMPQKSTWVNESTGEKIEGYTVLREVKRSDFEICYLLSLFNLMDKLGGKKYQVVKYIIDHKSRDNNTLVVTNRKLAKETGVSVDTVVTTLKLLKECNIIKTITNCIMVNPKFLVHGSKAKEEWIFQRFQVFDEHEEKPTKLQKEDEEYSECEFITEEDPFSG